MEVPERTIEAQSGTGAAAVVLSKIIVVALHFRPYGPQGLKVMYLSVFKFMKRSDVSENISGLLLSAGHSCLQSLHPKYSISFHLFI